MEADNNYKSLSFSNTPTTVLRSLHRMWTQIKPLQALSWQCALPDHNHSNAHITDRFTMEAAQFSKEISIVITVLLWLHCVFTKRPWPCFNSLVYINPGMSWLQYPITSYPHYRTKTITRLHRYWDSFKSRRNSCQFHAYWF